MEITEAIEILQKHLSAAEMEMNNFDCARDDHVNQNTKLEILHDQTEEYDFGWVFFYDSAAYIETGDYREALVGNAPLIFDKESREIIATGTAHDVAYYVNNYIKTGDPHQEK